MKNKKCETCGGLVEGRGATRFCSYTCSAASRKRMVTCEACGAVFNSHRAKRFCSQKCAGAARQNRTVCGRCGTEIKPPRKFCSRECWYSGGLRRGDKKLSFTCVKCGKTFERWASQRRQAKTPYCSTACYHLGRVYKRGDEHPLFKGGARWVNANGYVVLEVAGVRQLEHRVIMEEKLGRPLTANETVHHINGDRSDNRVENLQLRQGNHGKGTVMACLDCGSHNVGKVPIAN